MIYRGKKESTYLKVYVYTYQLISKSVVKAVNLSVYLSIPCLFQKTI